MNIINSPTIAILSAYFAIITPQAVRGWPIGAPLGACERIVPVGHELSPTQPIPNSADQDNNPFLISTDFPGDNDTYYYCPEQVYNVTLAGSGGETFRGLLIQGRQMDDTPVGSFTGVTANTQLSSCSRPASAVTHRTSVLKTSETFDWTAPAVGAGPIRFQYAVVVRFAPGSISRYFAPLNTDYVWEGTGTQFCPDTGSSGSPSHSALMPLLVLAAVSFTIYVYIL